MAEEAARDYQSSLEELTFNSKLHINVLTMIAGENHENGYAENIVKVIENRITKAPSSQKLPVLYLMDSIMKNLRDSQYSTLFSPNIGANFALVFEQVDEKKRQSMYKLRQTWNDIFPNVLLYGLDCKINELDPAWPITAQKEEAVIIPSEAIEDQVAGTSDDSAPENTVVGSSIHVNPKFLKKQQEAELARKKEEEEFRAELLLKQKELEERKKKREEEEAKKKWEEEQQRKMREEFLAKQQELMRLQQQKLELELEETRRNLRKKEIELKRKEELDRIKEQEREKEHQRQLEEARKLHLKQQEEERKERERKEREKKEQERKERERKEREKQEAERKEKEIRERKKLEESKKLVRNRDPRRANESRKQKANIDSRNTPSPSKLEKPAKKSSPVPKVNSPQMSEKIDTRNRKERTQQRQKAAKVERHYRRSHCSSSSESEDEKTLEIRPKSTRSKSPDRRKRKLSPSGTEVIRHKKSSVRSRDPRSAAASEPVKAEKPKAEPQVKGEDAARAPQSPARKKSEVKKEGTDLLELFGKEDVDYRKLPTIPKRQPPVSPESMNSPSVGWTKFKQARPETFSFKQPRRMSVDAELRSPLSAIRGSLAELDKDQPAALSSAEEILKYAELQRARGILTKEQHEDLLKQLAELYRLQRLREEARKRRDSTEKKQMPILKPPPKPPLLEAPTARKTLLPDPVQPGREQMMNVNFHDESSRSPHRLEESVSENGPKAPLLPPPVPPRALLEAPRRPGQPLLEAPNEGPLLPGPSRQGPLLKAPIDGPRPPKEARVDPVSESIMIPRFERPREPSVFPGGRGNRPSFPRPRIPGELIERLPPPLMSGPEPRFASKGDRELMPKPMPRAPVPLMETNLGPWVDDSKVYVPECDQRWYRRVHFARDKNLALTKFEVVINGSPYDIKMTRGGKGQKIPFGSRTRFVRLDPETYELYIDNQVYYRLHEHERTVVVGGNEFHVYLRGPPEKLWIDGHQFELRLDAPPESVLIANVSYDLIIDRQNKKVVVDGVAVCPWDTENTYEVFLNNNSQHTFQFFPPSRRILIDGEECVLDLSKRFPAVEIKGKWHGIRFDGPPKKVFVNDKSFMVHVDKPNKIRFHGRPYLLALGGPGHEIIIEDEWYEVKFGGPPVFAKIGGFKTFKLQLEGPPPQVKILGIVKTKEEIERPHEFTRNAQEQARGLPSPRKVRDNGGRQIPSAVQPDMSFEEERDYYSDGSPCRPELPRRQTDLRMPASKKLDMSAVLPQGMPNPNPPAGGTALNVNELFSKLLSTGIIKKVDGADSPMVNSPASLPNRDSPVPGPDQTAAQNVMGLAPIVIQPIPDSSGKPEDDAKAEEMEVTDTQAKRQEQEASGKTRKDYYRNLPSLIDLDVANLKRKYRGVIQCMYTGIQCTSCAARFLPDKTAEYKEHLDWHFRQNKRETQDSKVIRNRRWYYEITDWVQYEEIGDVEERVVSNYFENMIQSIQSAIGAQSGSGAAVGQKGHDTCPVASGNDEENMCEICRDPFEQFYDDEEEEWHLRDAIRVDGRTYHPVCYEDFKEQLENNEGREEGESQEDTPMDVSEQTDADSGSVEPPKAEHVVDMKAEAVTKEVQSTAPAPILDMVTNPLAYLNALSQRAKQANTSLNEAAKLPVADSVAKSAVVKSENVTETATGATTTSTSLPESNDSERIKEDPMDTTTSAVSSEVPLDTQHLKTEQDANKQSNSSQVNSEQGQTSEEQS